LIQIVFIALQVIHQELQYLLVKAANIKSMLLLNGMQMQLAIEKYIFTKMAQV